jgi:hypothetical protein
MSIRLLFLSWLLFFQCLSSLSAQTGILQFMNTAKPLQRVAVPGFSGKTILVLDGKGREYARSSGQNPFVFTVSGALGKHQVWLLEAKGQKKQQFEFEVDTRTEIKDGGSYQELFRLCYEGMNSAGELGSVKWNGKSYRYLVPWMLDHGHTLRGQKYFVDYGHEFLELQKAAQRPDGMIYSFIEHGTNTDYFLTRDKFSGYTVWQGDKTFTRQPTENHPEYMYVNTIYQCWKAGGDDAWMQSFLTSASKALDYTLNDPARWSQRFQLLKRVYTIDSWDFAVEDEYLPNLGLTNSMIIDPERSKFGVFFGDNTGYIAACMELAEMLEAAGQKEAAQKYLQRGLDLQKRLNDLCWNGRFYTHFIDEDPNVVRKLGVDEKSQIAQSNTYSLNRPLQANQAKAILETYLNLKQNLPPGSPGEFYAIYPPFEKGFEQHGAKWQYMNGGIGGHVAGELARGAFAWGYEKYGIDILDRILALGKKHNNKLYFAYTGAYPAGPPPAVFRPIDLKSFANMDFWVLSQPGAEPWMRSKRVGDDLRELPTGEQTFASIKFQVIDPAQNQRKAVLAVSRQAGLPVKVEIPINQSAASIYLLHTSSKPASEQVVGAMSWVYEDGSSKVQYLMAEKHLTYWWFSSLKTEHSGIAWYGKNLVSEGVGLSWCALDNPFPQKKISKIVFHAPESDGIYTLFGLSLADQKHPVPVPEPSFGGPDNWSAALIMAALVEGLAGVKDAPQSQAFSSPVLAPCWGETRSDSVEVHVKYPSSNAYLAYRFQHLRAQKTYRLVVSASGEQIHYQLLLPEGVTRPKAIQIDGKIAAPKLRSIEKSTYLELVSKNIGAIQEVVLRY